ncbi:hypothetical protein FBY35_5933 [Streptomyces sp. SLBN-118]|uniref:hypothetical protein n=1 Tax=Streptomyces sp. SLBN-118 TaxID=2768454 RepID=UPI001152A81E|nr:hypothetical protein [Streptomyces sp. SLBN-118]TQK44429.1 hypothetical protein FBY35_5933 [Streptomyces sp. SLBN-118]
MMAILSRIAAEANNAKWWVTLVVAGIAAFAAISAAVLSLRSAKSQAANAEKQRKVDFLRQQLNELYGPIYMRRRASESLRDILPHEQADGSPWRLVDHIEDVKSGADHAEVEAVEQILEINSEIESILTSKAGLYESFPPPDILSKFIAHVRLLRISWERGENQSKNRIPFPDDLDEYLMGVIGRLRSRLEALGVTYGVKV